VRKTKEVLDADAQKRLRGVLRREPTASEVRHLRMGEEILGFGKPSFAKARALAASASALRAQADELRRTARLGRKQSRSARLKARRLRTDKRKRRQD
jgi:hypothetical protein